MWTSSYRLRPEKKYATIIRLVESVLVSNDVSLVGIVMWCLVLSVRNVEVIVVAFVDLESVGISLGAGGR